ncbi:ferredoxin [Streptomyces olivaceus]|uniref:ferredoxin n=1 Tax=Streptomyces olivaceus TaxID=47716 RepID=UPI004055F746
MGGGGGARPRPPPAPDVFTQDDDGYSTLQAGREDGGGSPLVREAARACPVGAITVSERVG